MFLLVFFCVLAPLVYGQQNITGKVTDEMGPLPGVNIVIMGTLTGTVTDFNGNYSLTANPTDTLLFSYIGYVNQKIVVGNQTVINVVLMQKKQEIDEVVVVGYGTMKKSDLTGATQTVKVSGDQARQTPTIDQMLQGRASGVQVVSGSGNPGEAVSVRIRGTNSLMGNTEPLYVVDGVIITTAGEDVNNASRDGNDYQQPQNGLAGINPDDIESMEVLKDASATAIYGSRGANGVVIITTKSGKKGKMNMDAFFITGVSMIDKKLDVLDGPDYALYQNEASIMKGQSPKYHIENGNVYPLNYNGGSPVIGDTPFRTANWQDEIFETGISYNAGVSFSGGSSKGNYYVSASYNDINGIVENSKVQSGNFRINVTQNINDNLKVSAVASAYISKNNFAQAGSKAGSTGSFVKSTITFSPLIGDDVSDFQNDLGLSNPMAWIKDYEDLSNDFRTQLSLRLEQKLPVKGLKVQIQGATDIWQKERRRWYGITTNPGFQSNARLSIAGLRKYNYNIDNLLLYNRTFKKKHSVNATLGYVFQGSYKEDKNYDVIDFVTYQFTVDGPEYGQIASRPLSTYPRNEKMNSFLARVNYSFNHRYSITATIRADGSSKFTAGNKYSYFPSFSVAWRINEESFMEGAENVSSLKLRLGWGMTGNQAINPYQTFSNFGVTYYSQNDNSTVVGFAPNNIANVNLKWETTSQLNVGLDYGFFNNRLSGAIDGYYKETYDLLQNMALPTSTGYKQMLINRGDISNWGVDFNITGTIIAKKDIYLSVGGNISYNKNKIMELGIPDEKIWLNGEEIEASYYFGDNVSNGNTFKCPANIFLKGQPIGMFIGYKTDGIVQEGDQNIPQGLQPGDYNIIDLNGDGKIDTKDRAIIGDPNPDFSYGINVDFEYKRFTFSLLGYGVYGNDIVNGAGMEYYTPSGDAKNINPAAYHEAWRPERPSNSYPRILFNEEGWSSITDRIVEDGSYFRLTNMTLGYNIPLDKTFKKFHIYASCQNLFTITGYSNYDPNVRSFMGNGNIVGVDWNPFPSTKTFILGLNVSF